MVYFLIIFNYFIKPYAPSNEAVTHTLLRDFESLRFFLKIGGGSGTKSLVNDGVVIVNPRT